MTTAQWIAKHDEVLTVIAVSPTSFSVERKRGDTIRIAAISLKLVDEKVVQDILTDEPSVDFILNIPKEALILGSAFDLAEASGVALGDGSDLFKALAADAPKDYLNREAQFVLRGLRQHSRVEAVSRLDNRRYRIERDTLPEVVVLVLNEYEITADVVRTAIDKFGQFQAIVSSNPNSSSTSAAFAAAHSAGLSIWKWGEFLGQLNRQWT